jgi:hypothetical protein
MATTAVYFSIDNTVGGQWTSPRGFVYVIPAYTFWDPWDRPVQGTVNLQVFELMDKRSLFYAGYSSLSDRCLLDMEYCIDLQIVQKPSAGIRQVAPIRIFLPSGKNTRWSGQEIYQKQRAKVNLLKGNTRSVWTPSNISLLVYKNGAQKEATFYAPGPGVYMVGKEIKKRKKARQRAMISVSLSPGPVRLINVQAYLVLHESDTIVQLEEQRGNFSAFHLPKGKKATLLMLALQKKQFYFYRQFLGALDNQRIEGCLQLISSHQLQAELQRMIF